MTPMSGDGRKTGASDMANFQKNDQNVHGTVLKAVVGQAVELELWGPFDIRTTPATELRVSISPPLPLAKIEPGAMVPGRNVRVWRFTGLPVGRSLVEAKDSGGATWSQVTIVVTTAAMAAAAVVTRDQLKDAAGVVQPKYPPSPAIVALIALLTRGTNSGLRAAVASLESAGRSGNLYEHTGGLALDIYRLKTDAAQRLQAHNLIRFFVDNRRALGWRNMFYESWGFGASGPMGGSGGHDNHIHIDWMDFSTLKFDGSNKFDRSTWTEITWPPEALDGSAIDTEANAGLVRAAWGNTSASPLTDADIPGLYR